MEKNYNSLNDFKKVDAKYINLINTYIEKKLSNHTSIRNLPLKIHTHKKKLQENGVAAGTFRGTNFRDWAREKACQAVHVIKIKIPAQPKY